MSNPVIAQPDSLQGSFDPVPGTAAPAQDNPAPEDAAPQNVAPEPAAEAAPDPVTPTTAALAVTAPVRTLVRDYFLTLDEVQRQALRDRNITSNAIARQIEAHGIDPKYTEGVVDLVIRHSAQPGRVTSLMAANDWDTDQVAQIYELRDAINTDLPDTGVSIKALAEFAEQFGLVDDSFESVLEMAEEVIGWLTRNADGIKHADTALRFAIAVAKEHRFSDPRCIFEIVPEYNGRTHELHNND